MFTFPPTHSLDELQKHNFGRHNQVNVYIVLDKYVVVSAINLTYASLMDSKRILTGCVRMVMA